MRCVKAKMLAVKTFPFTTPWQEMSDQEVAKSLNELISMLGEANAADWWQAATDEIGRDPTAEEVEEKKRCEEEKLAKRALKKAVKKTKKEKRAKRALKKAVQLEMSRIFEGQKMVRQFFTKTGLSEEDLIRNRKGKVVQKKRFSAGSAAYQKSSITWHRALVIRGMMEGKKQPIPRKGSYDHQCCAALYRELRRDRSTDVD